MRLDALTLEILRNYLQGAVEGMAYVVERTAYTTFVKETADFTCGLLNPSGEFFAYPVELGVASFGGISYAETLEAVGPLEPGDIVITNDPYGSAAAATHLPDIHLIKPIFWEDRLVAYGAGFLHSSDVGGMVPASITPRASEIFQEGLRLPPKKLFKRGEVNRDLLDVILANCRIPEQNWGDLQALVAGLTTGERRMHELIRRFGPDTVDKAMDDLIDYATRKVEALIRRMPAGRYEFSDYIEDDVVTKIPIRLKVALTIGDGEIHLDFTGSDIQVSSALNVPTAGKVHPFMSVALVNYFATRDRTIPLNAGVLRRVRMTLPEGSVVNPKFPAACGVRYATVLRIYDAVLGALALAVPEDIPAASGGQGCMVALSLPDPEAGRRHVTVIEPMIGGGGGRPARDGVDGCDASLGFLKTTPAETLEAEVPIVVRRFHLIPDSAGPGAVSRWLRRAPGLPGLPAGGPGNRARDGAAALRALGRGGRQRRCDRQRDAEPGDRRRAGDPEDRRARARARRRAQRPHTGRRRPRRSLHAPARPRARRRSVRAGLARARARSVRGRPRRRPGGRAGHGGAARRAIRRRVGACRHRRGVRLRNVAPRARAPLAAGAAGRIHRPADVATGAVSRLCAAHALRPRRSDRRRASGDAERSRSALERAARCNRAEVTLFQIRRTT